MKILVAPNAYKGSLDSVKAAETISKTLRYFEDIQFENFPIADGGDSTLKVFAKLFNVEIREAEVHDPLGRKIKASWGVMNKDEAIIEMAQSSGVSLLSDDELNPLKTNTYGTGQLILKAINEGIRKIYIGLGGSATVDAGLGMLQALGVRFYNENGDLIEKENPLTGLAEINWDNTDIRLKDVELVLLVDVDNPLLGDKGAAKVFGPQKGADQVKVEVLEKAMKKFSGIVIDKSGQDKTNISGAGAAGGIAYTFASLYDAKVVSGIDFIIEKSGIKDRIMSFDLIITGEGKLDSQTIEGKGPGKIARLAKDHGIPCIALSGIIEEGVDYNSFFTSVFNINHTNKPVGEAIKDTRKNLEFTVKQIIGLLRYFNSPKGKKENL